MVDCLNLQTVDGRQIRIDWDPGFKFGRQFGRGKTGGQVRDELNNNDNALQDKDRPVNRQMISENNNISRGGYQQ